MEYININRNDNSSTTTYTRINGPVGNIISLIIALPIFVAGLVMVVILSLSLINDYKTKDFIKTDGLITNHIIEEEIDYYSISYKANQNEQNVERILGAGDYKIGDKVKIMYDPNNIEDVTFVSDSFSILFYGLMILFLSSITVIIRNIRSIKHYINPQKYEMPKENHYISSGVSNTSEDIFDDKFKVNGTQIRL